MEDISKHIQSIDEQIAQLARQKANLLEQTRSTDLETCKRLIKQYGFSKSDLGFIGKAGNDKSKTSSNSSKPPKYANPKDKSKTWNGHGRKPAWLNDALAQGSNLNDFLIHP